MKKHKQALRKYTLVCKSLYQIEGLVSREKNTFVYQAASFSNQQEIEIHEFFPPNARRRIDGSVSGDDSFKQALEKFIQKISGDESIQLVFRENDTVYFIYQNEGLAEPQNPKTWGSLIQPESVLSPDEGSLITSQEDVIQGDEKEAKLIHSESVLSSSEEESSPDSVELPPLQEGLSDFGKEMKEIEISKEDEQKILAKFDKDIPEVEVPQPDDLLIVPAATSPTSTSNPEPKFTYKKESYEEVYKSSPGPSFQKNKKPKKKAKKKRKGRAWVWYVILLMAIWYLARAYWENAVVYEKEAYDAQQQGIEDLMPEDASSPSSLQERYDQVGEFINGMAKVKLNNLYGFINEAEEEVIAPQYEVVGDFSEGLVATVLNGLVGYIDTEGRDRVPHLYQTGWPFQEGLAMVELNGLIGFVDSTGKVVVSMQYEAGKGPREGRLAVKKNGKWAICDMTGREITPFFFKEINEFREGFALVNINDSYGFINYKGEPTIPPVYERAWNYSEGLAAVALEGKIGFINDTNALIIPMQFDDVVESFYNGQAKVVLNQDTFLINKRGTRIE